MMNKLRRTLLGFAALLLFALSGPVFAAYAFVQQSEVSVASQTTPLNLPSITTTTGHALVLVIYGTSNMVLTFADGGIGNTYTNAPTTGAVDPGPGRAVKIYYAQNITGGATAIVVTATTGALNGAYVAEYSGLATSGMLISSIGSFEGGSVGQGANVVTSGSLTNSVSAMLFGFTFPDNAGITVLPTAGTSPTAFTGRTGVWATANGNTTGVGIPEDAAISVSAAATFGNAAGGLQFDNFITVAAVFALPGAGGSVQPRMMLMGIGASLQSAPLYFHDIDPFDFRRRAANDSDFSHKRTA